MYNLVVVGGNFVNYTFFDKVTNYFFECDSEKPSNHIRVILVREEAFG